MAKIEPHILRTAQRMLDRFGDDALREIELRIHELQQHEAQGDAALWRAVREAVRTLRDDAPDQRKH